MNPEEVCAKIYSTACPHKHFIVREFAAWYTINTNTEQLPLLHPLLSQVVIKGHCHIYFCWFRSNKGTALFWWKWILFEGKQTLTQDRPREETNHKNIHFIIVGPRRVNLIWLHLLLAKRILACCNLHEFDCWIIYVYCPKQTHRLCLWECFCSASD